MILVIDVGNTNVVFGLFRGRKLIREWRCPTDKFRLPKIKAKVTVVVVASVVPALGKCLKSKVQSCFAVRPFFVTAKNIPGLKVKVRNKGEVGADRAVNALAAHTLYKGPCVIVDFGTATTFDVVSAEGEYLGGAIAPGIDLARDALHNRTAKLPKVKIKAPSRLIGNDTVSAMQSGLVYGYVAMVEGMVGKIKSEIRNPKVIATGGLAKLICKYTRVVDRIDTKLTLKGLRMIGEKLNDRRA
ncbi:type III pantothenate kinase [Candidatus Margulisiibacteriota bacterium]